MSQAGSRLSSEQLERVQKRAKAFQQRLVLRARGKVTQGGVEGGVFFAELFRLAAEVIETDVETFCDLAEATFEEIEAFGQEPLLDDDWLGEVTGDKDNFYFSTENLVSDLVSPIRKGRRQKQLCQEEQDRLRQEVENAIIDEAETETGQDYEQAISVAHGENVQDWVDRIKTALDNSDSGTLDFWVIRNRTGLRPAELFLGLLLGHDNWHIKQDAFYGLVSVHSARTEG